jgi:hypothetical protein
MFVWGSIQETQSLTDWRTTLIIFIANKFYIQDESQLGHYLKKS